MNISNTNQKYRFGLFDVFKSTQYTALAERIKKTPSDLEGVFFFYQRVKSLASYLMKGLHFLHKDL